MEQTNGFARKAAIAFAVALASIAVALSLTACGPSEADEVKQIVDEKMSVFYDPDANADYIWNDMGAKSEFKMYLADDSKYKELLCALLDGYYYELDSIELWKDVDAGQVKLTMHNKGIFPADFDVDWSMSQEEQDKTLIDGIKNDSVRGFDVTLGLKRVDGKWQLEQDSYTNPSIFFPLFGYDDEVNAEMDKRAEDAWKEIQSDDWMDSFK